MCSHKLEVDTIFFLNLIISYLFLYKMVKILGTILCVFIINYQAVDAEYKIYLCTLNIEPLKCQDNKSI